MFGAVDLISLFIPFFGNYTVMNVIYGWKTHPGRQSLFGMTNPAFTGDILRYIYCTVQRPSGILFFLNDKIILS